MLHTYKIVAIEVEKFGRPLVRTEVFLRQFKPHLFGVVVTGFGISDLNGIETLGAELVPMRAAEVSREGGNAALAGKVVSYKCDARRQRETRSH